MKAKKTWLAELDIYGIVRTFDGLSLKDCPFRYQGQYEDAETGLYYNRFRYYDPDSGNYLSQDPIGLAGGHTLYSYVYDPNTRIDKLGLYHEYDTGEYGTFNTGGNAKDGYDGHEMLQSQWLREHGHGDRSSDTGKQNPAIALDTEFHRQISAEQRAQGLYDKDIIRGQSAQENINQNADIMRSQLAARFEAEGMSRKDAEAEANRITDDLKKQAENFCAANNIQ